MARRGTGKRDIAAKLFRRDRGQLPAIAGGAEANWAHQTIWTGDNLDIMRGMNSESVDLIYLDPPFNSNQNYAAPIGSEAAGAAFKDTWTLDDVDLAWHGEIAEQHPALYTIIAAAREAHSAGMMSYLIMMAVRLLEMRRLLKPTGSIYLHCDPTASHYLKMTMDAIFGRNSYMNNIVWSYRRWPTKTSQFQRMHDDILFYAMHPTDHTFNVSYEPPSESTQRVWKGKKQILLPGATKKVVDGTPSKGLPERDVFIIGRVAPRAKERTGYPTQKPLKLLERILLASSNEGDMILDPFCGCATACVAAQKLGRQWVGIDISPKAAELVNHRLQTEIGLEWNRLGVHRTDIPQRSDLGELPHYKTHKHTLFGRQEGRCNGCRTVFPFQNFTIDHIVPQVKGGSDHIDNLQLLCNHCNSVKGTGTQEELLARLRESGIVGE